MKHLVRKAVALCLAITLAFGMTACGEKKQEETETIVNIGATDSLGFVNPLLMDWTFSNYYTISQMFLPLVRMNPDFSADYCLAESITTEDNINFTVKLRDDAKWSDGEPITAQDVVFTFLKMSSPEVANYNFDFSVFQGMEEGLSPSGATEIAGIEASGEKTVIFRTEWPIALNTFINNLLTWICIIPEHVLKDVASADLPTSEFFSKPTVVSGPYFMDSYDLEHFVSFHANENYFGGAPKIDKLNLRIVQPSEILAGLKNGEIDIVLPAMGNITTEDREAVEKLEGVRAVYAAPITNEMTFINTQKITDPRVRQAIVYAIDREALVRDLLKGHGEVTDGFLCSASPYFSEDKAVTPYDPAKAKELLAEAGWDGSQAIEYYVSSNDDTVIKAAQIMKVQLEEAGITINIHTVDFATLMDVGGSEEVDMFSVQYTITPNDYYSDLQGLIDMEGSWTGSYYNEEVHNLLLETQVADESELKGIYARLDAIMTEEVPVFPLYFMSNLGVVSDRLVNAEPSFYGPLNNVQNWEVK